MGTRETTDGNWHDGDVEQVREADRSFFAALLTQDAAALGQLLDPRFVIVDVASGAVTSRADFLAAVVNGGVHFDAIETATSEALVRGFGSTAVVVGHTRMRFTMPDGRAHDTRSRYTHVFVAGEDGWQLASAQGTAIA